MGVVVQAISKICDPDAGEKAYISYPPEQFLRETNLPETASGRLRMGWEERERNNDMEPQPNGQHGCMFWRKHPFLSSCQGQGNSS